MEHAHAYELTDADQVQVIRVTIAELEKAA